MADILRATHLQKRALCAWKQHCAEQAWKLAMIQAAKTIDVQRIMKKSFRTWLLHSASQAQQALALLIAEAHDQRRCKACWFEAWKVRLLQGQHEAAILHHTAAVFHQCYAASMCFGWWWRWVCISAGTYVWLEVFPAVYPRVCMVPPCLQNDLRKQSLAQTLLGRGHWEVSLMRRVFGRWNLFQQAHAPWRSAVGVKIQAAHARRRIVAISRCWIAWVERCKQRQVQEQQCKFSHRHHCRYLQARAVLAWRSWLADQRMQQHYVWVALQSWRSRRLSGCIQYWRSWTDVTVQETCGLPVHARKPSA